MITPILLQQISCVPLFGAIVFIVFLFLIGFVGFVISQIRKVAVIITFLLVFWMSSTALSALKGDAEITLCTLGWSSPTMEYIVLAVMIFSLAIQIIGFVMGLLDKRKFESSE